MVDTKYLNVMEHTIYPSEVTNSRYKLMLGGMIVLTSYATINSRYIIRYNQSPLLDANQKKEVNSIVKEEFIKVKKATFSKELMNSVNSTVENAIKLRIQHNEIVAIKKKYASNTAIWLPSTALHPDEIHKHFYGKEFIVGKGLYDESQEKNVIPAERYGCKCGMKILLTDKTQDKK